MISLDHWKVWLAGLIVVVGLGAWEYHAIEQRGALKVMLAATQDSLKGARQKADSLGKASSAQSATLTRSTVILTKLVSHTDTLHEEVTRRLTDTLFVKDVLAQDTVTIRACMVTVSDCTKLAATNKAGWEAEKGVSALLSSQVGIMKRQQPSGLSVWLGRLAAAGVGFGLARIVK